MLTAFIFLLAIVAIMSPYIARKYMDNPPDWLDYVMYGGVGTLVFVLIAVMTGYGSSAPAYYGPVPSAVAPVAMNGMGRRRKMRKISKTR
jgi:hypothetical protein